MARKAGVGGDRGFAIVREAFPRAEFIPCGPDDIVRLIGDCEVFVGRLTEDEVLAAGKLRWVHSSSLGVDWLAKAPSLISGDVVVTNPRGAPSATMAEHAFAMILAHTRQLYAARASQQNREWAVPRADRLSALARMTMVIVGSGNIGAAVARRAHGFEMNVVAVDMVAPSSEYFSSHVTPSDLRSVLPKADVLVICAPLTAETRGMIGEAEIALMKPSAILVPMSRGQIVDEAAVGAALRSGRLGAAGFDVFGKEPLDPQSPLWDCGNATLTAHYSGRSDLTDRMRTEIFLECMRRYLAGEAQLNVVDKRLSVGLS